MVTATKRPDVNDMLESLIADEMLNQCIAFDEFSGRPVVLGYLPWDESGARRFWTDADDSALYAHFQHVLGRVTKADVMDALRIHLAQHRTHPVREWLRSLPPWDGQHRVDTLFHDLVGADATPYTAGVARIILLGAISRVMWPGCKFDIMPVLQGRQGCGKSTLVSLLATRDDWYLDGVPDLTDPKAFGESIRGKWVVEASELDGLTGRDVNKIKAAITRRSETYRAAYGRHATDQPRQCVLIGTSNEAAFLADTTGNRRFLIVECGRNQPTMSVFDRETAARYIRQVWAEALAAWDAAKGKPQLWLSPELEAEAEEARDSYATKSDDVARVLDYLDGQHIVCASQVVREAFEIKKGNPAYEGTLRDVRRILDNQCPGWVRYRASANHKARIPGYGVTIAWEYVGEDRTA